MLPTSTRRPPARLPQPRRRPACRLTQGGREAGRRPSPCGLPARTLRKAGPKPPSGDGSAGVGPKALGGGAKGTRSVLPAFHFSVAPRLPLSANATTKATAVCGCRRAGHARLGRRCGNAGDCRKPPGEADNEGEQRARMRASKRTKCLFRAQKPLVRAERPKHGIPASTKRRTRQAMSPPLVLLRLHQPSESSISTELLLRAATIHLERWTIQS